MTVALPALVLLLAPFSSLGPLAPQDPEPAASSAPAPTPTTAELLAGYRALPPEQRHGVVRSLERQLARNDDPVLQRLAEGQKGMAAYPQRAERAFFDPKVYAPVAPARTVVAPGLALHRTSTKGMAEPAFADDLHRCVVYDWAAGKPVKTKEALTDDETFENLARGYPPGTDHTFAMVLAKLDGDAEQRRLAEFFEHLYADRDGRVFAGVSLYAAWCSGRKLEMPDVDAIAYARTILGTRSFVSPIPDDRRRERLYAKIREGFAAHREHRTMLLAAAAAFVAAEPTIDASYATMLPRMHWLWASTGHDVDAVAAKVKSSGGRSALLAEIDRAIGNDMGSRNLHQSERAELAARADYLKKLAARELARAQAK